MLCPTNGMISQSLRGFFNRPATRHESHVDTHTDEAPEDISCSWGMSAGVS